MNTQFNDITITGLNKERSYATDGGLFRVFLTLSSTPTGGWEQVFDSVWSNVFYSMKRRAGVQGDCIWIICEPPEIQKYHLEELRKAVAETNSHFRAYLRQQEIRQQQEEALKLKNKQALDSLGNDLKF